MSFEVHETLYRSNQWWEHIDKTTSNILLVYTCNELETIQQTVDIWCVETPAEGSFLSNHSSLQNHITIIITIIITANTCMVFTYQILLKALNRWEPMRSPKWWNVLLPKVNNSLCSFARDFLLDESPIHWLEHSQHRYTNHFLLLYRVHIGSLHLTKSWWNQYHVSYAFAFLLHIMPLSS